MDVAEAEEWIRDQVVVAGAPVVVHERPWSSVMRVPLPGGASAWFKACALAQAFEPALTSSLCRRWPDVMPALVAEDVERGWLLLGDAGARLVELDNPPEAWLRLLPLYAELQRGEAGRSEARVRAGVPISDRACCRSSTSASCAASFRSTPEPGASCGRSPRC